jgi:excisionase family DNA binding protein
VEKIRGDSYQSPPYIALVSSLFPVRRAGVHVSDSRELINPVEAAKLLGVDEMTVKRWAIAGKLPHWKIGKRYRFSEADILAFLDSSHRPVVTAS